jgi:hypothetical protein
MALPTILLREFQSATVSDWVPGKLAAKYEASLHHRQHRSKFIFS